MHKQEYFGYNEPISKKGIKLDDRAKDRILNKLNIKKKVYSIINVSPSKSSISAATNINFANSIIMNDNSDRALQAATPDTIIRNSPCIDELNIKGNDMINIDNSEIIEQDLGSAAKRINNCSEPPKDGNSSKKIKKVETFNLNKKDHMICSKDYALLTPLEAVKYDTRSFKEIFMDKLLEEHILVVLFFKKSVMDPLWIRIIFFMFSTSITFALNAMFYTDDYINTAADSPEDTVNGL